MYRSVFFLVIAVQCSFALATAELPTSAERIPHGEVALADGEGIVAAWYACPTQRYPHAVLGDDIEGGCLVVQDENGDEYRHELSQQYVFEDVTPRIADMNNDGRHEVVTIRSDVDAGAALVIYELADTDTDTDRGALIRELAATPPIGRANRWLAPAGIADFNNDGRTDVAYVQTPHIGGILRVWSLLDAGFTELARLSGLSNHSIGSSRVSISRVLDDNADGVADIALPDQSGTQTVVISLYPKLRVLRQVPFDLTWFVED